MRVLPSTHSSRFFGNCEGATPLYEDLSLKDLLLARIVVISEILKLEARAEGETLPIVTRIELAAEEVGGSEEAPWRH